MTGKLWYFSGSLYNARGPQAVTRSTYGHKANKRRLSSPRRRQHLSRTADTLVSVPYNSWHARQRAYNSWRTRPVLRSVPWSDAWVSEQCKSNKMKTYLSCDNKRSESRAVSTNSWACRYGHAWQCRTCNLQLMHFGDSVTLAHFGSRSMWISRFFTWLYMHNKHKNSHCRYTVSWR